MTGVHGLANEIGGPMKLIVITVIITLSVLPALASERPGRPVLQRAGSES